MTDFIFIICVLSIVVMYPVPSSARTLTLADDRCFGPYNPTPRETLNVIHEEDRKSSLCKDMSFSGWDDVDEVSRESCVKVTDFQLDCSQTLEYRAGTNRGKPTKRNGCNETEDTIPVFCTFKLLYIEVDEPRKNHVNYTVYSGAAEEKEGEDFTVFAIVASILMIVVFVVIAIVVYACKKNVNRPPASAGRAVYTSSQPQQVNVHHYYHPVNQNQTQEDPSPTLQQHPGAFVAYPYATGQEISPPQTDGSIHRQTNDTGEPPSYEEVTKKIEFYQLGFFA